jgi:regulator of replication initiation timing
MYDHEDSFEVDKLRSQIRHLRNELDLVREENEATTLNYYDLYKNLENQVAVRTEELKKAMETIDNYNHRLEAMLEERTRHLIKTERHAAFSLLS